MMDWMVFSFVQWMLWIALGVSVLILLAFIIQKAIQALSSPAVGPDNKLMSQLGRVVQPIAEGARGKVVVFGEIWDAVSDEPVAKDTEVRVIGFDPVDHRVLKVTQYLSSFPGEE